MRVSSDLSQVKGFEALPKDIYILRIHNVDAGSPENPKKGPWEPHNPGIELTWKIDKGDYANREIRFDFVEVSGQQIMKDGTRRELVPFKFAELIMATKVPWTCKNCSPNSVDDRVREIVKGTGENGFEKGSLFCPDCGQKAQIDCDVANLVGLRCKGGVDIRKGKDDKEYNYIRRYAPLLDGE